MRITTPSFLVAIVLTAAPLCAQPVGNLVGCIRDGKQQPLPRVTVLVRTVDARHTMLADADGCYEFKSLPSNVYRVTVRLQGFNNETRDKVNVSAGIVRVDFEMRVSRLCECVTSVRPTTLRELWEQAAAVVHVRITAYDGQLPRPEEREYFPHTATVLEVLKRHPAGGPTDAEMTFMQGQLSPEPEPSYFGEELVIFLPIWSPTTRLFYVGGCCTASSSSMHPVENGRIVRAPISGVSMRVEDLLAALRALSTGQ